MAFSKPSVVIDIGSYCCKAGFACDNHPVVITRSVVGRPKNRIGVYGKGHHDVLVGDEALERIEDYELQYPVTDGKIVQWDNMERIWHHLYYKELKVAPEERPVILACNAAATIEEKVQCCEVFFETLNAPAMCIQIQSVLALYGAGFTTGVSVDLGFEKTEINAVYEGGLMSFANMETYVGGKDISKYIKHSFQRRGINLGGDPYKVVEDLLRRAFYILPPSVDECRKVSYTLPSGEKIDISKELHCATELLFHPEWVVEKNPKSISLQDAVVATINKCDSELHSDLYNAIVPTGGVSSIPGFMQKFTTELEKSTEFPVNVLDSPEAYCVAWLGAAVFAGMSDIKKVSVSKKQFEEYGAKVVKNKFT